MGSSMYLEYFGLDEPPFRITPHTDFFFPGAKRGAFLEALLYAVGHDEGIIKVSGEVGTGKTMLARMAIARLPDHTQGIYLADPLIGREALLHTLADELGMPTEPQSHRLLRGLQERLIELYGQGRRVVLLVDEAHAMPPASLEEIRLLSNLESERHKLLQIVLLGQPELDDILAQPAMRQLKDRITQHFRLQPLNPAEVAEYVAFRMHAAGYRGPPVFDAASLKHIARLSGGLTRRINVLADKALLAAFAGGSHAIGKKQVRQAARDAEMVDGKRARWWWLPLPALALAVLLAWLGEHWHAQPPDATAAPATFPSTATSATTANAVLTATANERPVEAPARAIPPAAADNRPPAAPGAPPRAAPPPDPHPYGAHIRARLDATSDWLRQSDGGRWMVQVASVDAARTDAIENLVNHLTAAGGEQPVHLLESGSPQGRKVVVLFGDFPDRSAASRAQSALPPALRAYQPYPRTVRALRGR